MWERYSKNDLTASEPAKTLNQLVSWQLQQKKKAVGKNPKTIKQNPNKQKNQNATKPTRVNRSNQSCLSEICACSFFFGQAVTSKDTLEESCCLHCFPTETPRHGESFLSAAGSTLCVCLCMGACFSVLLTSWHCKGAGVQTKIMHCTENS